MKNHLHRFNPISFQSSLLFAVLMCLGMFAKTAAASPIYSGPGWVDSVPLGNGIETWQTDWTFNLITPGGSTESISTTGSMDVARTNTAVGDGFFETEILSMSLSGNSSQGPVTVSETSFITSSGEVTQTTATEADSFFNVFFELEISGFSLFNTTPMRFSSSGLTGYPPDGSIYSSPLTVALVLDTGDPSGFALSDSSGMSIAFESAVVPVPAAVWLFGTALIGLVGFSKRKKLA